MELTIEQAMQQGVTAHKEGKLEEAEQLYRAILQSQPKHPDANHNLGILAVSVNKADKALLLFKSALEANPKIEQFWLSYIDALIKDKQFDNAKAVLKQGKSQGVKGEKVDALEERLTLITEAPKSTIPKQKKSLTLSDKRKKQAENKKQKKAKKQNLKGINPSEAEINNFLQHYQNGRFSDAEKLAILMTQTFPTHQFGWKVLGILLKQTGRVSESLVPNQKSVQLAPLDAEAQSNLGNTLQELGRLEEAEPSYKKAIVLKPDYAEAHSNLGATLQTLGRLEEAEASYKKAITLEPDYAEAHSNLGSTLKELGRLDESEASFTQAIALKPDLAEAHSNLGNTLQELGKLDEALASYTQAIALKPDYAEAHNNLGNTLKGLGRLDEAEASYTQAIALKHDYAEALLNFSITQSYMNNLEAEIVSLKNVLQIDSDDYGLRAGVNLAICNFLEGNFADSKQHLLAAVKIQEKTSSEFRAEKVYQLYLLAILNWHEDKYFDVDIVKNDKTLYVIGESHSLVSHQLHVQSSGSDILCKAKLIKGCMQWHLGSSIRNQYKNQFESLFCSIPKSSEVLLAIGEIDCRLDSGIIKHKNKFPTKEIEEIIVTTVENYLTYIVKNNFSYQHNIIIQGVPCPNIDTGTCSEKEVTQLIEVIQKLNCELQSKSKVKGFGFLDVYKLTDRGDGLSNTIWHIDDVHLSPDGMMEAWRRYASKQKHE